LAKLEAQRTEAEQKLQNYRAAAVNPLLAIGVAASIQDKEREIASLTERSTTSSRNRSSASREVDQPSRGSMTSWPGALVTV